MTQPGLIYDIGAHQGDDTGWYLQQGFRVVAVEANPLLAQKLEQQFSQAIGEGKLIVVNTAITGKDNETIPFYISKEDGRSSTLKHLAERDGHLVKTIDVTTARLSSLFTKYGTPYYCKIDIEGNDALAINSLVNQTEIPRYLSCEHSCFSIEQINTDRSLLYGNLDLLHAAGFTAFQLIDQDSLLPLTANKHYSRIHSLYARVRTKLERITGLYTARYNNRLKMAQKRATISGLTTAPFGDQLPNVWASYETTRQYLEFHFNDYYVHTQNKQLTFWVDIHARH
ncbi:FkbM family methyltransferase [Niastella sp. OAS944]|uniref:FkbM family methyltransferase n=1 Tax=Niastella sp. OAS944 TaxID=2664089 RepID=UPI0034921023|nr:FkbM family methyltransferase [Chitinophagaceae bacterium OAS944]